MMEAVKIGGRLDLIECLLAAGGRLDVQVGMLHPYHSKYFVGRFHCMSMRTRME